MDKKKSTVLAIQHGGTHYKGMGIEPVQFSLANNLDCLQFSVVKYVSRHKLKGTGVEDLKKCIHFAQMALEQQYGVSTTVTYGDPNATAPAPPTKPRRKPPTAHLTARRKQK